MATNQDALLRQWHMLRRLPRYPQKVSVQDLASALRTEGFDVTERTIQRDLVALSGVFPLAVDDREKPFGWSWQREAPNFDLPGLSVSEALTLILVEQHLRHLLPGSALDHLAPFFLSARRRLDAEPQPQRNRAWLNKVRSVPPAQPLVAPDIDPEVEHAVSDALLQERQLEITYQKRGEPEIVRYRIHPLGLVQRGPVLYLYCRVFDYADPRTLAMHRIRSATPLDVRARYPAGFNLDRTIEEGTWGFGRGGRISVELRFAAGYGDHLYETPLSRDQRIEPAEDGGLRVTAMMARTPQLEWWLLGFGDGVEVVGPAELRNRFREIADAMQARYGSRGSQAVG